MTTGPLKKTVIDNDSNNIINCDRNELKTNPRYLLNNLIISFWKPDQWPCAAPELDGISRALPAHAREQA